jgi:hypothetical protein
MRKMLLALLFPAVPALVHAGTAYDMTVHVLAPSAPPSGTNHYFAEDGKVRFVTMDGKAIVIAKDKTIYTLDTVARTVMTLDLTLDQMNASLNASSARLRDVFANEPSEQRRTANQLSEAMERQQKPQASDYVLTGSSESVGGRTCQVWERSENGIRRRQICVAPVDEVPGGTDILAGMKSLSELYGGSVSALGIGFGVSPWWSSIESLHGVPLLIREFDPKGTAASYEVTFTGIHVEPKNPALFDIPEGYEQKGSMLARPAPPPGAAPAPAPTR